MQGLSAQVVVRRSSLVARSSRGFCWVHIPGSICSCQEDSSRTLFSLACFLRDTIWDQVAPYRSFMGLPQRYRGKNGANIIRKQGLNMCLNLSARVLGGQERFIDTPVIGRPRQPDEKDAKDQGIVIRPHQVWDNDLIHLQRQYKTLYSMKTDAEGKRTVHFR